MVRRQPGHDLPNTIQSLISWISYASKQIKENKRLIKKYEKLIPIAEEKLRIKQESLEQTEGEQNG